LLKDLDPRYSQRRYYHEPIQNLLSSPVRDLIHILFQNSQTPSKLSVCAIQINASLPSLFFKSDVRRMKSLAPSSSSWKAIGTCDSHSFPKWSLGVPSKMHGVETVATQKCPFCPPAFVLTRAFPQDCQRNGREHPRGRMIVAEEIIRMSERTQWLKFLRRYLGRWKFRDR
jgi:hypothetical protein